jgi:uncharacterized lipoprotein
MRTLHIAALTLSLLVLSGCSMFSSKEDYKSGAGKARPLEVPPDLVAPSSEDHYTVPEGSGTSYSEYAKVTAQAQACTCPPANGAQAKPVVAAVAAAPAAPVVPPKLQDMSDGSKAIAVAEPFDRCWEKVNEAMDRARIALEDKDRSAGILYLKGGHNQITVKAAPDNAAGCTVAANNGSGTTNDETKKVIDSLYKALGK